MVELVTRLVIAALLCGSSLIFNAPDFALGWRVALAFAAYSAVVALMERRGLRTANTSSLIAVLDAAAIALVAAGTDRLDQFGFLVLAPCAYACVRHGSSPASMAPIAAASLVAASILVRREVPNPALLAQTGSVLMIGLLLSQGRAASISPVVPAEPAPDRRVPADVSARYLRLRENFRSLRDHSKEVERKSRRARVETQLYRAAHSTGERLQYRLANKLREMTSIQGLSLLSVSQAAGKMVLRASSGDTPSDLETTSIDLTPGTPESIALQRLDQALRALRTDGGGSSSRSVLLKERGRILGAICLMDRHPERLDRAEEMAEEAASVVAELLKEDLDIETLRLRLREVELLYALSSISSGADSATAIAARVVRELWGVLDVDHLGIQFVDGSTSIPIASQGASANLVQNLVLGSGTGVAGWLAAGAQEAILTDATADPRIEKRDAMKRRVGSFALVPIQFGEQPFGFITAATHRIGGLGSSEVDSLRIISAELGHAIARLEPKSSASEGLATPREFQRAMSEASDGCVVYLEPIWREELIEEFGQHAFDHAIQQLARRLRVELPSGGLLCWRSEGDYVAFLRDCEEPFARSWANSAAATASMTSLRTPDGRARIPLALKARVSEKSKHSHLIHALPAS